MDIQFLWWKECASHEEAWQRLMEVVDEVAPDAAITRIEVRTDEEAEQWHFPGSPTILVDGVDIDPNVVDRAPVDVPSVLQRRWAAFAAAPDKYDPACTDSRFASRIVSLKFAFVRFGTVPSQNSVHY